MIPTHPPFCRFVSKYRPAVPVIVVTDKESTARGASVVFGQYALKVDKLDDVEALITQAKAFASQKVGRGADGWAWLAVCNGVNAGHLWTD